MEAGSSLCGITGIDQRSQQRQQIQLPLVADGIATRQGFEPAVDIDKAAGRLLQQDGSLGLVSLGVADAEQARRRIEPPAHARRARAVELAQQHGRYRAGGWILTAAYDLAAAAPFV